MIFNLHSTFHSFLDVQHNFYVTLISKSVKLIRHSPMIMCSICFCFIFCICCNVLFAFVLLADLLAYFDIYFHTDTRGMIVYSPPKLRVKGTRIIINSYKYSYYVFPILTDKKLQ